MGRQLSEKQLTRLEKHNYSCTSVSLLEPVMQKLWCWLVEQCPMSLAPNLITISGLVINVITCIILIYYSPDAKQEVPCWASFLCALGLFIYQSLDAIDGKQARRTGTSSPLGELFDHGCDSLSTVFVSLSVCCAVQLGSHPYWMFFQCVMAVTLFYCAHWQTYVSGTLKFGFIDVTEAQFSVIFIFILSSIFKSSFWNTKIPVIGLSFKCIPTICGITAGTVALFNNFKVILIERGAGRNGSTVAIPGTSFEPVDIYIVCGLAHVFLKVHYFFPSMFWQGVGKNGSTVAGTSVLSPVVPLFLMIAPAVVVAWKSPHDIYLNNRSLYLLTFGFVAARVTNRLVVAHMTKSEMAYTDASMLGPLALFLNQYFNCLISEHILLYIVVAYVTYDLIKFCRDVCLDICEHLDISLFVINPRRQSNDPRHSQGNSKYNTRSKSRTK